MDQSIFSLFTTKDWPFQSAAKPSDIAEADEHHQKGKTGNKRNSVQATKKLRSRHETIDGMLFFDRLMKLGSIPNSTDLFPPPHPSRLRQLLDSIEACSFDILIADLTAFKLLDSLAGWFGHNPMSRFQMPDRFEPIRGAGQFVHSNPDVFSVIALYSSLQLFAGYPGGLSSLRARSEELTGYLEICLQGLSSYVDPRCAPEYPECLSEQQRTRARAVAFTIITPSVPAHRGSQLSLLFLPPGNGWMNKVARLLLDQGIIGDERQPDVLRLTPVAMYSSFED
ncbi:hypothetical protein PCASD_26826, partial [Puccinia coronata f. sp. avenae]